MKNYELKLEKMIADFKDDLAKELITFEDYVLDDMPDHIVDDIWEQIDRWTYEYIKYSLQEHKSEIIREICYQCNIEEE